MTELLIGKLIINSSDHMLRATHDCFGSTINNTGHVNKTSFLRCIDEQNIHSDQISDALLLIFIIFAIGSTIINVGLYSQSKKNQKIRVKNNYNNY